MRLLNLFSRTTTSGRFIAEIDGLRFVAISSVILYHVSTQDFPRGAYGVQLFFAISGFILGLPFAARYLADGPQISLKNYFLRRLTRLEPPYLLSLFATFAFGIFVSHKLSLGVHLPSLGASVLYLHNLIYGHESYISTVAWSLEVEVQFYCLVPVLTSLFLLRGIWVRRGIIAAVMGAIGLAQTYVLSSSHVIGLTIVGQLQFFLTGFLLVDIFLVDWKQTPQHSRWWDAVWIASIPLLYFVTSTRLLLNIVFPFAVLLFYCATFQGQIASRLFRNPALTIPGGMCYTIYLYHSQIMSVVQRLLPGHSKPFLFVFQILAIAAVCGTIFVLIEKPCMNANWPRELMRFGKERANIKAMKQSA